MSESMPERAEVVVCGAGIAGIAAAYWLSVRAGVRDVLLVDARAPLTLTSDKSTEAYRNWWPGPDDAMVRFMNRSIDLLDELADESDNVFQLNRRGYVYATARTEHVDALTRNAELAACQGAGTARVHARGTSAGYVAAAAEGFSEVDGADLIVDRDTLRRHFPYLSSDCVAVLHARRCGWFSGQQLGMYLLERARERGTRVLRARVEAVERHAGAVSGVRVRHDDREHHVTTPCFVNAAGPFVSEVGALLDVHLPVFSELHVKASIRDVHGVLPRNAPLVIWEDPQKLDWSDAERAALAEDAELRWLLEELPPSVHTRPEGGGASDNALVLWPYDAQPVDVVFPIRSDPVFPEVVLRGIARAVPGMRRYLDPLPRAFVDGGYYTKTRENRFLVGPLPVEGAFVLGALSGYGLMAACGAAELLAAHITGAALPTYAPAFAVARYDDPAYVERFAAWGSRGQL